MQLKRLMLAVLLGAAACSDDDDPNEPITDVDAGDGSIDGDGSMDGAVSGECGHDANQARIAELTAGQPTIGTRSKEVLTQTISFESLGDDPSATCSVELTFKDLNGDGELTPYEDWSLSPSERAADLLSRMDESEKQALMAHAILSDVPEGEGAPSAETEALISTQGIRFGVTAGQDSPLMARAAWANEVQALCEATSLGIPFVLSQEPSHAESPQRTHSRSFSQWPLELGLAASGDPAMIETFGQVVATEYRAIGISMALSPLANLATEPRWYGSQFTFGENSERASEAVASYVRGAQGESLSSSSVAVVLGSFPGAGAAKDGFDPRLESGQFLAYSDSDVDQHLAPFAAGIDSQVSGIMPSYGIPETGAWTGLDGLIDGSTIEQVGASYNATLLNAVLRDHYEYAGMVVAPPHVLDDTGSDLAAPWGVTALTRPERIAEAVGVGVDQFIGLNDVADIAAAVESGAVTPEQVDASATRALELMFGLGLFDNPYVEAEMAPAVVNTDDAYRSSLAAMNQAMVLIVNNEKPAGFLNGTGDGTQTNDKANAGNGSGLVLPAPPGEPYVSAGCSFYVSGDFSLDYVRSVSNGYGILTNDVTSIGGQAVTTDEEKIAYSDYVFVRVAAPFTEDPDSGALNYGIPALGYGNNDNADALEAVAAIRTAIDSLPDSQTQLIVGVDAERPALVQELIDLGVDGLFMTFGVTDKVFLDVAFGIVDNNATLPVGLPASAEAGEAQLSSAPNDGQDSTFVEGYGLPISAF